MTAYKNKRCTQCTAYGNVWHGFNVPYGALYGISDNIPYVVTENYAHTQVRVWVLSGSNWIVLTDKVNFVIGTSKKPSIIHGTIVEKCKAWCKTHEKEPSYKTFRESGCHKLVGVSRCLPKDRNPQREYIQKALCYHRPSEFSGYALDSNGNKIPVYCESDASQDVPVIRESCYWQTGKNTPVTSHKKIKCDKPSHKEGLHTLTVTTPDGQKETYKSRLY